MFIDIPQLAVVLYFVLFGAAVVVVIVFVQLMLAATVALRAFTRDRDIRLDLLLAGGDDVPE